MTTIDNAIQEQERNRIRDLLGISDQIYATPAQGAKADTALQDPTAFATAAQGTKADTALQPTSVVRQMFNSGGLTIKGALSAVVKTVNTIYGQVGAAVFTKAASDMSALVGTVTNAKFNVFVFMSDASAVLSSAMGTEGATLAAVVFPTVPSTKAMIGFVIINPTGTGNFVGGTTTLDDAVVTPNATYVNAV